MGKSTPSGSTRPIAPKPSLPKSKTMHFSRLPFTRRRSNIKDSISEPFGTVKNSRGPDLKRSETFMIVDNISDCASSQSSSNQTSSPSVFSNKIFAKFNQSARSVNRFASGASDITLPSTGGSVDKSLNQRVEKNNKNNPPPRRILQASVSTNLLAPPSRHRQPEDLKPQNRDSTKALKTTIPTLSGIPKSRTMNALHHVGGPTPRLSETPDPVNLSMGRFTTKDLYQTSFSKDLSTNKKLNGLHSSAPEPSLAQRVVEHQSRQIQFLTLISDPETKSIAKSHGSEYWTGRFMSLRDAFSAEQLPCFPNLDTWEESFSPSAVNSPTQIELEAEVCESQDTQCYPDRSTTPLSRVPSNLMLSKGLTERHNMDAHSSNPASKSSFALGRRSEIDAVVMAQRIFDHLESQCTTDVARESLRAWQRRYAFLNVCPGLMPREDLGATAKEQGFFARLLGKSKGK